MNKYFAIFILISALTIGAILVYTKSNIKIPNGQDTVQELSKLNSSSTASKASPSVMQQQVTELKIEDVVVGTGSAVKSGDTAEVNYTGTLLDGQKFDSSYDRNQTFSFKVGAGQVISGWDQGLIGMKTGGKRKLTIPSSLAYGEQGSGPIPPNTPLVFEIDLVAIK
ncbi:MAG: FKBP-type peptidyl-prolyl cis-trans isomerase [Patescibacteria group bacterium]